jgi:hypothetical protein
MSLAAVVVGFITSTITFAVKFFKTHFAKTVAEDRLEIRDVLLGFICEAEAFLSYSGEEKKDFVLTKIKDFAEKNGLTYNVERVAAKIDQIVTLSKLVNINKTN